MPTTLAFKPLIDLPEWRPVANAPAASAAGTQLVAGLRNNSDRGAYVYMLVNATTLWAYDVEDDDWFQLASPALTGTFGAGAGAVMMPSQGPRGTLAAGATTTSVILNTALPAAVAPNQLANKGNSNGFKVRIIGNSAGGSGKVEERYIVGNTGGTTPTIYLDSPLSFTPASGDGYEILSGRLFMLSAGTLAAGCWKYYDIATNSFSGNLATTNLPATLSTDSSFLGMDESYVPYDANPGDGFFGQLAATASAATSITGTVAGADAAVLANEYRNFQIRIVEDTVTPTAVGRAASQEQDPLLVLVVSDEVPPTCELRSVVHAPGGVARTNRRGEEAPVLQRLLHDLEARREDHVHLPAVLRGHRQAVLVEQRAQREADAVLGVVVAAREPDRPVLAPGHALRAVALVVRTHREHLTVAELPVHRGRGRARLERHGQRGPVRGRLDHAGLVRAGARDVVPRAVDRVREVLDRGPRALEFVDVPLRTGANVRTGRDANGAQAGTTYLVTNRIATVGGRTDDRTISVKVEDR